MNYNQDAWSWVDQQKPSAPMSNMVAPLAASQEQPPGIQVVQDPTTQQLTSMGVGKLAEGAAQGITAGVKAYGAPLSQTTMAANTLGQGAALTNAGATAAGASNALALTPTLTAAPIGGAGLGIGTAAAAPIGTGIGTALGTGAATGAAATGAAAGTGAATAGLGAAGAAGGQAALAAMGPIGWAIGAGLLAKKLGIF